MTLETPAAQDAPEPARVTPPPPDVMAARQATATPVMAQFLEMKAAHPDCLLFFRMGDFYELFFEDAALAARALGIALTARGQSGGDPIPMCGVPIHNAERYLHDLIRHGFRVAVAEQTEDPAEAKKRGAKSVVRREVVRLVTPGTLTEDSLLEPGRANHLCAFAAPRGRGSESGKGAAPLGGLAWTDMSTGALGCAPCAEADLAGWLVRLGAAELVLAAPAPAELRQTAGSLGAAIAELAAASFEPRRGAQRVAAVFGAADLDAFGEFSAPEKAALGALVDYLALTQRGRVPLLARPKRETGGAAMRIDPATRANLEITVSLAGARQGSLLGVVDRTVTSAGARRLEAQIAAPLTDPAAIGARHDAVAWLLDEERMRDDLRASLKRAPDLERALGRIGLGRGGPRDVAAVGAALAAAAAIRAGLDRVTARNPAPTLIAEAAAALDGHAPLAAEIAAGLVEAPPVKLGDGDAVAPGVDAALDRARGLRDRSRQVVAALQKTYQEQAGVSALKLRHNAVLGYFVETPATHARRMMSDPLDRVFIHRQTTANAVRFTTAELGELEAKIARAAEEAAALERAAFEALCGAVLARATELRAAAEALAALDVAAGHAQLAATERWTRPTVEASRAFALTAARHPVVEAALKATGDGAFVANDVTLDADRQPGADAPQPLWLVTGPNMAGKSTFLRQAALIAVLAQAGAFVPAASARIGVVDQLFSRVGASDDLARGRSTFMVEMIESAAILNQAGERALVILDEIGRGTATYDGLSIAWATLEHLHDVNRCRTLFATHYHELTALSGRLSGLKPVTVGVREWNGEVVFLRDIRAGAADRSYGVAVARLAGLPKAVIARAEEVLLRLETGAESAASRARRMVEDLPLFAAAEQAPAAPRGGAASPALDRLAALEPDAMSPREALEALYELKRLAAGA